MAVEKKKNVCPVCKGKGYIEIVAESSSNSWTQGDPESIPVEKEACENCDGKGFVEENV